MSRQVVCHRQEMCAQRLSASVIEAVAKAVGIRVTYKTPFHSLGLSFATLRAYSTLDSGLPLWHCIGWGVGVSFTLLRGILNFADAIYGLVVEERFME